MTMRLFRRRPPAPPPIPFRRRLLELEILTARLVRAGFAGQYHSAFHGRGIEFAQVREYQPGDDIRIIDWNVTARSGVPHVKQFVEERDLTVIVALDVSGSMMFGSLDRRKIDLAVELTAILSFAALQNGDRAGLVLFSDGVKRFVPPRRGRTHVETLVQAAIGASQRGGGLTRIEKVCEFLDRVSRKRAVVIVLSDFLDDEFVRPLQRLNRRHDVVALAVGDPRETIFPSSGLLTLVDAESGRRQVVDLGSGGSADRERALEQRFRSIGIDFASLTVSIPYERKLVQLFRNRMIRRR